jgi:hypothetical protein
MGMNLRASISHSPFLHRRAPETGAWAGAGLWPCYWIGCPDAEPPCVVAYRLHFQAPAAVTVRVHVTADERYELWLDGERIGRGPERGDPRHWRFETYDLPLTAGEHALVARVWSLGELAPLAQFSLHPGFLFCPEAEVDWEWLGTGRANWKVKRLGGYTFTAPLAAFGAGHRIQLDGAHFPWGYERGQGEGWQTATRLHPGYCAETRGEHLPHEHLLVPSSLPPMLEKPRRTGRVRHVSAPPDGSTHLIPFRSGEHLAAEADGWQALLRGQSSLRIPAATRRRVLIDLEDYTCAYPELVVSGGARAILRLYWQESLFTDLQTWDRGQRDEIEGRYFAVLGWQADGIGDTFILDGGEGRRLEPLWWSSGRYVELLVETAHQPLTLQSIVFHETRYPLEMESVFSASDPRLAEVTPLALRALQMCAHETYFDCPFYEQLMYVGDTRLECLLTYALTRDDRLPRKALQMFDCSRRENGLTQSRYPSRQAQSIPPFSLWWVAMIHDHLYWRGNFEFIRALLPGMRAVLDAFTACRRGDDPWAGAGLVRSPEGWNFMDWVPDWPDGVPPGGAPGEVCAPLNWLYVYALGLAAQVEIIFNEHELAARWHRLAQETVSALIARTWDAERGLFADDFLSAGGSHALFSEHSQCLALLSGLLPESFRQAVATNLFSAYGLTLPTVYFMHYYFETCRLLGRMNQFLERMEPWFEMRALGFKTTYENADPHHNRSDCHAWAAHPLYHYFASLLGIRPAGPGFERVEIRPQLAGGLAGGRAGLEHASGRLIHPQGEINMEVWCADGTLHGSVSLPPGVTGMLDANGQTIELRSGSTTFGNSFPVNSHR